MALPLRGVETTVEVVGELISGPTSRSRWPAWRVSACTCCATAGDALPCRPAARIARRGWCTSRATPRRRRTFWPSARLAADRCASRGSVLTRSRATSALPMRWPAWGLGSPSGAELDRGCRRRRRKLAGPAAGHRDRLQPHPGRGDDAGDHRPVCRRADDAVGNIASWRVKETDRIAAMATELRKLGATVEEGADFIRVSPPASAVRACAGGDRHLRRPPHGHVLVARGPRHALRINDPQTVAKTFPRLFRTLRRSRPAGAGDRHRRHLGLGQGDRRRARRAGARLALPRFGRPLSADRLAAGAPELAWDDEPASRRLPPGSTSSSPAGRSAGGRRGFRRHPQRGNLAGASRVAALPAVRAALLFRQRAFRRPPGLVADGRDMGSVVFPDATTKVFLTASVEMRASRRHKQLIEKGMAASIADLSLDLRERDERDSQRSVAPMQQSTDAELLDTTNLTIETAVAQVLDWVNKGPKKGETAATVCPRCHQFDASFRWPGRSSAAGSVGAVSLLAAMVRFPESPELVIVFNSPRSSAVR
jgi:hypothetical protein